MNFSYRGGKVFGDDIETARYNALLETFYGAYPNLKTRVRVGRNYFEKDPSTAKLLEQRVSGGAVYIPDEDQEVLDKLVEAYKSTKLDVATCMTQNTEESCKNLKFQDLPRCEYEKKWFSYIRGGNCFIDESIIKHVLTNLEGFIKINWETFTPKLVSKREGRFPNPDKWTKLDLANLIHDLTYHIKVLMKDVDLIAALEDKHKMSLVEFHVEELLYYTYLFSFIVYVSKFLSSADFKKFITKKNLLKVANLLNKEPSKTNLAEFVYFTLSELPKRNKEVEKLGFMERWANKPWSFSVVLGSVLIVLLLTRIPPSEILKMIEENRETLLYKATGMPTSKEDILKELIGYLI